MKTKKIKVLHYIPGFLYGGIESVFLSWFKNINRNEFQFELLIRTQDDSASALTTYREMGGIYYRLPRLSLKNIGRFKRAVDSFFECHNDYDILHVHGENPFILRAAKKSGIGTIIIHSHTTSSGIEHSLNPEWIKEYLFRMDGYITRFLYADYGFACSKAAADWKFGGPVFKGKKVVIIKNAIESDRYDYNENVRKQIRDDIGGGKKYIIGHIGRMSTPKNQFFLLDIYAAYRMINENSMLVIVGDGPLKADLIAYAKEKRICDDVMFLGVRNDIPDILQGIDCFLLPSIYEGLPVTLVEAQASGLPCIVSDFITKEAEVTPNLIRISLKQSAIDWANAIELCRNNYKRKSGVENVVNNGFDIKSETKRLENLYRRYVDELVSKG